jgi:hypothetical protein
MVMSVTRPHFQQVLMQQQTQGGGLRSLLRPHVFLGTLNKNNGERINVSWPVNNTGGATTYGRVGITLFNQPGTISPNAGVLPNSPVTLTHFLDVAGQPAGATVDGFVYLNENDAAGNFVREVDRHTFSIQTPAASGGLVAVGEPTIF